MIKQEPHAGIFEKTEHDIVTRALRLDEQRLGALTASRGDLDLIDLNDSIGETPAKIADGPFSHFPASRGIRSDILGIVRPCRRLVRTVYRNRIDRLMVSKTEPVKISPPGEQGLLPIDQ